MRLIGNHELFWLEGRFQFRNKKFDTREKVLSLVRSMKEMQEAGVWLIGTDDEAEKSIYDLDLTGPIGIVMGAEGEGMRRLTRETCDELVRIPMKGVVESLNVSVASGVCLYEALRQRLAKEAK